MRGDQIEVFKVLNGYENIDRNILFSVKEERGTRGHNNNNDFFCTNILEDQAQWRKHGVTFPKN